MAFFNFVKGSVYSFQTLAPSVLGTTFPQCTVAALLDFSTAQALDDVRSKHIQIYPKLDPALQVPAQPNTLNFVKFVMPDGTFRILAAEWINTASVSQVSTINATVSIQLKNPTDITRLHQALTTNGFTNFKIDT